MSVSIDEETPVVSIADARSGPPVHPGAASNVATEMVMPPDPEILKALAEAPQSVEATILHQRIAHCAMENRGVVAVPAEVRANCWSISARKAPSSARNMSAWRSACRCPRFASVSPRTSAALSGSSRGPGARKWRRSPRRLLIGRPVKWIEDRYENLVSANQAREQECTIRAAFDAEGKMLASHVDYALNNGAYPHFADAEAAAMMFVWAAYKMPQARLRCERDSTPTPPA